MNILILLIVCFLGNLFMSIYYILCENKQMEAIYHAIVALIFLIMIIDTKNQTAPTDSGDE